jgi:hypothetical protein
VLIKIVIIFLLFVTAWIILALVARYIGRRSLTAAPGQRLPQAAPETRALPAGPPAAGSAACCLQVPCSEECARQHQALRHQATARYDLVVAEMGKIIAEGADQDPHGYQAG